MRLFLVVLLGTLAAPLTYGQGRTDAFLVKLFARNLHPVFRQVMARPDEYRVQIIYTQIDRDRANRPTFTHYQFRVDSTEYFNPASTVKLPLALLSLEKLNALNKPGVTKYTAMQFDSAYSGQTREWFDKTAQSGYPSVAHLIRKAFLVSENDPYSRMYEFVGQQQINRSLHAKGYHNIRITHRFVRLTPEENRHTNPVRFIIPGARPTGTLVYAQPAAYNPDPFDFRREAKLGKGYYAHDSLIHQPFDFTTRNTIPLQSLQQLLQSTLFPESVPPRQRFNLTPDDYSFLYQYLSQTPGETNYPRYDARTFFDTYAKFFFYDSLRPLPDGVRVFNKVGWAYGFMSDVAYVADFRHKIEYMLAAVIYVNSDGILNDDNYEYDSIGHPFLYQLGQTIYQYERTRKRRNVPDLSRFRVRYEKRQPGNLPVVSQVDN